MAQSIIQLTPKQGEVFSLAYTRFEAARVYMGDMLNAFLVAKDLDPDSLRGFQLVNNQFVLVVESPDLKSPDLESSNVVQFPVADHSDDCTCALCTGHLGED